MKVYIRDRSDKYWVTEGTGLNRTRRSTPFYRKDYTLKQVQRIMSMKGSDEFLSALGIVNDRHTLDDVLIEYERIVDIKHGHKEKDDYCKQIKGFARQFVEYVGRETKPHMVKPKHIEDYLLYRFKGDPVKNIPDITVGTCKKIKCFIKQLFGTAISMNVVKKGENPVDSVQKNLFPRVTKKSLKKRHKPIKIEQIAPILMDNDIPLHHRVFWKIQYFTGFDPYDALNIKPEQLNMDNEIPTIMNERIKNGEEPNLIPIHHDLLDHDLIDLTDKFSQKTHREKLRKSLRLLRNALKETGYVDADHVDFKCLRHSFNQNMKISGMDDTDRIQLMGQSELKTNQTYTHRDLDLLNPMINKVRLPN